MARQCDRDCATSPGFQGSCGGDDIEVASYFLAHVELPGKTVRLNVTMDEGLVARIDRVARNRSAFLAEAARERLRELAQA
jgi:hypothetical protein